MWDICRLNFHLICHRSGDSMARWCVVARGLITSLVRFRFGSGMKGMGGSRLRQPSRSFLGSTNHKPSQRNHITKADSLHVQAVPHLDDSAVVGTYTQREITDHRYLLCSRQDRLYYARGGTTPTYHLDFQSICSSTDMARGKLCQSSHHL